jgi:hypothetical protein
MTGNAAKLKFALINEKQKQKHLGGINGRKGVR